MRFLLQRVSSASVHVDQKLIGKIDHGWLALIGIAKEDTKEIANKLCDKLVKMRCFPDVNGKMNKSVLNTKGSILAISQFTLYADCKKGNRPGFTDSAGPDIAEPLYNYICEKLKKDLHVETGAFGKDMKISLVNEGAVTIILDSKDILGV